MSRGCRIPRCPNDAIAGSPYCAQHQRQTERVDARLAARLRGYDARWAKLRNRYLAQHAECERCAVLGMATPAATVHHIVPIAEAPERRLDESNLMALCHACHRIVHARMAEEQPWRG